MFAFLKPKSQEDNAALKLYSNIVAQSREPYFYEYMGVPDTFDGRFDILCLHCFLVINRLNEACSGKDKLAQALFDHMFRDMDASLREVGVGDMGIPKHIKRMMKGFNGRASAYKEAVDDENPSQLVDVIKRNIYGTLDQAPMAHAIALARYIKENAEYLSEQPDDMIMQGIVEFRITENETDQKREQPSSRMVA